MEKEKNNIIDVKELLGYCPSVKIQIGLTDSDTGSITKVKVQQNGSLEYYWDFWGGGWYSKENLPEEARGLTSAIEKKIKETRNMTPQEAMEIMEAYFAGKIIQSRLIGGEDPWVDMSNPVWNFETTEYRVSPGPFPYSGATEFLEALRFHGPALKGDDDVWAIPVRIFEEGFTLTHTGNSGKLYKYTEITGWTWQDGTPVGKKGGDAGGSPRV